MWIWIKCDLKVETEYFLRIFTEVPIEVKQLLKDYPSPSKYCALCCTQPMCVTSIKVEGATGLAQRKWSYKVVIIIIKVQSLIYLADNTYCIIRVEREKLKSAIVQNSQSPNWNVQGVFFRYDICKPIFVEVTMSRLTNLLNVTFQMLNFFLIVLNGVLALGSSSLSWPVLGMCCNRWMCYQC